MELSIKVKEKLNGFKKRNKKKGIMFCENCNKSISVITYKMNDGLCHECFNEIEEDDRDLFDDNWIHDSDMGDRS